MTNKQPAEIVDTTCATNTQMVGEVKIGCVDANNNGTERPVCKQETQEYQTLDASKENAAEGMPQDEHSSEQTRKANDSIPLDQLTEMVYKGAPPSSSIDSNAEAKQAIRTNNTPIAVTIDTNDSPMQAVNAVTDDVRSPGEQQMPITSMNSRRTDVQISNNVASSAEISSGMIQQLSGNTVFTSGKNTMNTAANVSQQIPTNTVTTESVQSVQQSCASQLALKLPVHGESKPRNEPESDNVAVPNIFDEKKVPEMSSNVQFTSGAILSYLQELDKFSKQNREQDSFVPKLSPAPMYRGHLGRPSGQGIRRRRQSMPNMPINAPQLITNTICTPVSLTSAAANNGLDISCIANIAHLRHPVINKLSEDQLSYINGKPFRKLAPKPSFTNQQKSAPVVFPTSTAVITMTSPTLPTFGLKKSHVSFPVAPIPLQDQPLDLCTKNSPSNSTAFSAPSSPCSINTKEEPLNLSKNQAETSAKTESQLRKCPPERLANFWQHPSRFPTADYSKSGGPSSPLEGDTASDTAAISPGIDHKLSNELMMSLMNGLASMDSVTKTDLLRKDLPEGTVALPGPIRHYKLTPRMACQHLEPPTPERPYLCHECGATFKRNKSLQQHYRVHLEENLYDREEEHLQYSEPKQKTLFQCDACPRKFTHLAHLKRHARAHQEQQQFSSGSFTSHASGSHLTYQQQANSVEPKPFACPYCPLRFKYTGDVKRHVRVHTGEKPYVCGYCGMRFTQSNTLKQHERTHTGERPYACHKCDMKFTQSGSLKYHLAHRHPQDVQTVIITNVTNPTTYTPT